MYLMVEKRLDSNDLVIGSAIFATVLGLPQLKGVRLAH